MPSSRRSFLSTTALSTFGISTLAARAWARPAASRGVSAAEVYPRQNPALVREAVVASHGNAARLREIVETQPAYARASYDWGFGDWETCIDAAAHVGNGPIAEFLLSHGARPTIFSAAMMGQLATVTAFIAAQPGIHRLLGPHGITLMAHARAGGPGAASVVEYLKQVEGADTPVPTRPLAAADRDALCGKYIYGPGPRDYFAVDVQRDLLGIERAGGPARRGLAHVGNLVFFPAGVPTVTIAFTSSRLTVADGHSTITARRA